MRLMINWLKKIFIKTKSSNKKLDDFEFNELRKSKQEKIDYILDKISKKGINSLTKKEKEFLDSISNF